MPRPADEGREAAAKEEGILKSGSADKARRLKEVETEIERQLRLLPAVVRVKANVAPAEEDPLATDPPPATASVVLICKDKQPTFADDHVQKLVAGSVPKLKPENVRVAVVYEPPRPAARRPAEESRRKRVITGIVLVSVLSVVLIGLVIQARRKRNNSAAPFRDPDESLPEHGGD